MIKIFEFFDIFKNPIKAKNRASTRRSTGYSSQLSCESGPKLPPRSTTAYAPGSARQSFVHSDASDQG